MPRAERPELNLDEQLSAVKSPEIVTEEHQIGRRGERKQRLIVPMDFWRINQENGKELNISQFIASVDVGSAELEKYERVLEKITDIISNNTTEKLVDMINNNEINYTALLRLLEEYAKMGWLKPEAAVPKENLIKLINVLTETGYLKYDLNDRLKNDNLAKYYSVLRGAELELKNKTLAEVQDMARENKLHISVVRRLAEEYDKGRQVPEGIKEKINAMVKVYDKSN